MRAVCEADITCSALKVDDTADADALLEKATEALKAAGHEEKLAARDRRLAECTGASGGDERRQLFSLDVTGSCDMCANNALWAAFGWWMQWMSMELLNPEVPETLTGNTCMNWCGEYTEDIQKNCRYVACTGCPTCQRIDGR